MINIGSTLERILAVYREQAGVLIPLALILFIPAALLQALAYEGLGYGLLITLLITAISTIATYLYEGMVVQSVRDLEDGVRDHTMGTLARSVVPVLAPVIGASILAGFGIAIGFLLLIVPGLILLTLWAVVVPVLVIERPGLFDAFGRSQRLVRHSALQVFAVLVVLVLIQAVVSFVLALLLVAALGISIGTAVAALVVNTLLAPVIGIAVTVLYLELIRIDAATAAPGGSPVATAARSEPVTQQQPAPAAPAPDREAPTGQPAPGPQPSPGPQSPPAGSPPPQGEPPPRR